MLVKLKERSLRQKLPASRDGFGLGNRQAKAPMVGIALPSVCTPDAETDPSPKDDDAAYENTTWCNRDLIPIPPDRRTYGVLSYLGTSWDPSPDAQRS